MSEKHDSKTDVHTVLADMISLFTPLKRSAAAFTTLTGAYTTVTNPEAKSRPAGLPIFEFSGVLLGSESREVVKCVQDLKNVRPELLGQILLPMIQSQAGELKAAIDDIVARGTALSEFLTTIAAASGPAAG